MEQYKKVTSVRLTLEQHKELKACCEVVDRKMGDFIRIAIKDKIATIRQGKLDENDIGRDG